MADGHSSAQRKLVEEALLHLLDGLDNGQIWRTVRDKLMATYAEDVFETAYGLARSAGFVNKGFITWQGHEYRHQKRHRFAHWWSNNWFPAIVAALTIPTGILTAAKLLIDLLG